MPAATSLGEGAPATVVRVDQAGYPDSGPKVAYVMSGPALSGDAAVVDASGEASAHIRLGSSQGAWNHSYRHVYRVDLSTVRADGTYTVQAGGVSSPAFPIAPAGSVYRADLRNALSFYQDERDGPDYVPSPLRTAPGHLDDEQATVYRTPAVDGNGNFSADLTPLGPTIDASGGWWDAGDYLKFTETTSDVVAMMLEGVLRFPAQMGAAASGQHSDFTAEARFGVDFLTRLWDQQSETLYLQVGIGAGNNSGTILSDHDIWRLPQADDTYGGTDPAYKYIRRRPVFEAGPPASPISPNLAGRLAADFGLCAQEYRTSDPALAARCLHDGETIYGLARTTGVGRLETTIPYGFYPEATWQDDMELGATELAVALQGSTTAGSGLAAAHYLGQAARWARAYIGLGPSRWDTLQLYDVAGLAHYELYNAIGRAGDPAGLAVSRAQLASNMASLIGIAVAQSARGPYGNGASWASADSVSSTDGISVMASEYDAMVGTNRYAGRAQGWLDNNLGANPWGLAFLVGDGSASPVCLSHQVANLVGSLDGASPQLLGAAVEGPAAHGATGYVSGMQRCAVNRQAFDSASGVFVDDEQSYDTTEPAIDLTASSPLAFAWLADSGRQPVHVPLGSA